MSAKDIWNWLTATRGRSRPGMFGAPGRTTQPAHYYSTLNRIIPCAATAAQIDDLARRFAAPGQPGRPIKNGVIFPASVAGVQGHVRSTYYPDYGDAGNSVITTLNVTQPDHPLYKGSITRDWFRGKDGAIWAQTIGRGVNKTASIAGLNQLVGAPVFDDLDSRAAAYAARNICK